MTVQPMPTISSFYGILIRMYFFDAELHQLPHIPTCSIPCDHVPVRSWPLFQARDLMRNLIESLQAEPQPARIAS